LTSYEYFEEEEPNIFILSSINLPFVKKIGKSLFINPSQLMKNSGFGHFCLLNYFCRNSLDIANKVAVQIFKVECNTNL
jgi:hypothetical protein